MVIPVVAQDGPSLPPNLEPITADNVGRMEQIASVGGWSEWATHWSDDGQTVYLSVFGGALAYSLNDLDHPQFIEDFPYVSPYDAQPLRENLPDPIAISSDGRLIVHHEIVDDYHALLHIIDSQTQQEVKTIEANNSAWWRTYSAYLFIPRFSSDGLLFMRNNAVYRWNLANDMETLLFSCGAGDVFFSPTGKYAATAEQRPFLSMETTFRIWDLNTSPATMLLARTNPPTDSWQSVAISPDGHYIAAGGNGANTRIWDVSRLGFPYQDVGSPNEFGEQAVADLAYSPDGRYLAGAVQTVSGGLFAFLRDAVTGEDLTILYGMSGTNYSYWSSVAFHPAENAVAFGTADGMVWLWNIDSLIAAGTTTDPTSATRSLTGHTGPVTDINFSPDGNQIVTASWDHTVRLWDYHTGEMLRVFEGHTAELWTAVFDPQGKKIASGGDDCTIRLWDIETGEDTILVTVPRSRPYSEFSHCVLDLAFSPASSDVLVGTDENANLYFLTLDSNGIQSLRVNSIAHNPIWHLAFNPEGTLLVIAGRDSVLRLWGVPTE
jgi:WD40 repeat protein